VGICDAFSSYGPVFLTKANDPCRGHVYVAESPVQPCLLPVHGVCDAYHKTPDLARDELGGALSSELEQVRPDRAVKNLHENADAPFAKRGVAPMFTLCS